MSKRRSTSSLSKKIYNESSAGYPFLSWNDKKEMVIVNKDIQSLEDLIELGNAYDYRLKYNINMEAIHNIVDDLRALTDMVGLDDIKQDILDNIIFLLTDSRDKYEGEMMHIVITGPPGTGKTQLAQIIGRLYARMGMLDSDTFIVARRDDLVGEYLGQTAPQTRKMFKRARGGVLFIDEAYSLGSGERRGGADSYSVECINTINQCLSEMKNEVLCIIAGYRDDIDRCFFAVNKGLARRFPFRYNIEKYTDEQLVKIFKTVIRRHGWEVDNDALDCAEVGVNRDLFSAYGGSCETLVTQCKISWARENFCSKKPTISRRRRISRRTVKNALKNIQDRRASANIALDMDRTKIQAYIS